MAQLIVAAAGAAIGGMLAPGIVAFGMTGASIGWMAGSMLGSAFAPTQKGQGPRLDDLKVSSSSYGTPIPYLAGHPRVAGQIVWASAKREIATTQEAGKGGGGSEYTTYTYEVDLLYLLSDNEIEGMSRVWKNGELVYSVLIDSDDATVDASINNGGWSRMTVYTGSAEQLPDPDYEAAVGTANAPAYRGRGSVFIKSLQLGGSGQIPNLTFEVQTNATFGGARTPWVDDLDTLLLLHGEGGAIVDSSSYGRVITVTGTPVISTSYAAVGESSIYHGASGFITPDMGTLTIPGNFCVEGWFSDNANEMLMYFSSGSYLYNGLFRFPSGATVAVNTTSITLGTWRHLRINRQDGVVRTYTDGVLYASLANSEELNLSNFCIGRFVPNNNLYFGGYSDEIRISNTSRGIEDFVPNPPTTTIAPIDTSVLSVTNAICLSSGLSAGQFDTSALSTITRPVRAMAISQVSSARTVLEMLGAAYHFDCVLSDKLYFRPRASASAATLTFDEFGVAVDSNSDADPLPLMMANELEIPAQMAITFSNTDGDYQTDTQYSDRLLTGQESTSATVLPLGFTASEGKQIADALLLDKAVSALTTTVSVNVSRTKLEPTDVVTLTADDGSTFRMRVTNKKESNGVITLGCVADDSTVFTQAGVTAGGTASQTVVLPTPTTDFALLDIPLLRDADNLPGFYVAVEGSAANWSNCAVYTSLDDLTYSLVTTMADQTAIGTCTTTLGDWTGGNVFDETNTVTVDVGAIPQLASVTRDDLLTNQAVNAALIGGELVQYRTATLVSAGVYTLSGLLRGRRGTEWASTGHAATERFVVLGTSGMRHIALQSGDLGSARYYKVVSAGQRLSAVTAQAITPAGVALECFSPVNARANRDTTDTVLTWTRRTRLSTRLTGTLPISAPLGETSESYEVEVWDATYTTLKRTITAASETATYTSAQQVTDFGSDQTVLYLKIYQLSATVGRGYPLTVSI